MAMKPTVNARVILTIALLSGVLLVVIMVAIEAWFLSEEKGQERLYDDAKVTWLEDLRAAQQRRMAAAPVSIEDAMTRVVAGERPTTRRSGS